MKITALSRLNNKPEEAVRQALLKAMVEQLGYPRQLLAVEKELSQLPHLQNQSGLPKRRADILCFGKDIHPQYSLFPLLLIECKAGKIGFDAEQQALGYNHFVQAPYVALANLDGPRLIFPQKVPFLPTFQQLMTLL